RRFPVASRLVLRWAAQQPQNQALSRVRYTALSLIGGASHPNAGQARSPQMSDTKVDIIVTFLAINSISPTHQGERATAETEAAMYERRAAQRFSTQV
ncbi:hypothetical protein, partial [Pseudomonas poae]